MNRRTLVCILLIAAGYPLLIGYPVSSQQSLVTTSMTLAQPAVGKCTLLSLAFVGQAGKEIAGTFGSDIAVDFYILTPQDFLSIQNTQCRLPENARPLYVEMNEPGYGNPYRSLPFPSNGTYYFVFVFTSEPTQLTNGYAAIVLGYPASTTLLSVATSSSISSSTRTMPSGTSTTTTIILPTSTSSSSTPSRPSVVAVSPSFNVGGAILGVALIAVVGVIIVFEQRRRHASKAMTIEKPEPPTPASELERHRAEPPDDRISTGYTDLDDMLLGGLPKGYAILLSSIACDERDLLVRKIVNSAISSQIPTLYISNDPARVGDLLSVYAKNFYALTPQADKLLSQPPNLFKIETIESFSDISIAVSKVVETDIKLSTVHKLIVIDLLTDILLEHKSTSTRKWLSDFIAKRKAEGFTILASLNPEVAPKAETTSIIDLFDGVIDVYERDLRERPRRFLIIKKLYAQRYSDTELMLDKEKLF